MNLPGKARIRRHLSVVLVLSLLSAGLAYGQKTGLGVSLSTLQRYHARLKIEYSAPGRHCPPEVIAVGNQKMMRIDLAVSGPAEDLSAISIACKMPGRRELARLSRPDGERLIDLSRQGLINVVAYTLAVLSPDDPTDYRAAVARQVEEVATAGASHKTIAGKSPNVAWSRSLNTYSEVISKLEK
jgi:hypothetical protein